MIKKFKNKIKQKKDYLLFYSWSLHRHPRKLRTGQDIYYPYSRHAESQTTCKELSPSITREVEQKEF